MSEDFDRLLTEYVRIFHDYELGLGDLRPVQDAFRALNSHVIALEARAERAESKWEALSEALNDALGKLGIEINRSKRAETELASLRAELARITGRQYETDGRAPEPAPDEQLIRGVLLLKECAERDHERLARWAKAERTEFAGFTVFQNLTGTWAKVPEGEE